MQLSASPDQYSNGEAVRAWNLYTGDPHKRTAEYGDTLVRLLRARGVRTVLDAAAGIGVDSLLLLSKVFKVTSVDLNDGMVEEMKKERVKRGLEDWQIGNGDWLDLEHAKVTHPKGGYDAVICIGNSFAHLPDSSPDQRIHRLAISNFRALLRPGGTLVIDHRNYDYIVTHGAIPNTNSKLYYQGGDRIHSLKTELEKGEEGKVTQITLRYEIDMRGHTRGDEEMRATQSGEQIPVCAFTLTYFPHLLGKFLELLSGVFGKGADHVVLEDFKEVLVRVETPSYFIHLIRK